MPPRRQRGIYNAPEQQVGEQQNTVAGRDISQGANANAVLEFLRDYVFEADQQRETTIKDVGRELRRTREDVAIVSDAVRSVRDRMDDDDHARVGRQASLDAALAELHQGQRIARRWLAGLTAALVVAALVVAWLAWRELYPPVNVVALLRLALGGALALVAQWRR